MRALHVVGEDFELRLGVHLRLAREEQVAARLRRIGLLRARAHQDLAVEHRMRRAAGDALVQLAAHAVGLRMVDQGMGVRELLTADQRDPVDRAFGAFGRLHDVEVEARKACAERHAHRAVAARPPERHRAVGDMKRRAAFALHAHLGHAGLVGERDFGDGVGEGALFVQRDVILDQGQLAAGPGHHQAARMAHRAVPGRDEQQMHRRRGAGVARRHDHCAVMQESRVERGERALFEKRVAAQMGFEGRGVRLERRRQVHRHAGALVRGAGELRGVGAVDEHQPDRRFVEEEALDVRGREAGGNLHRLERAPGERRQIGEAPLFVGGGRHGERAGAIHRVGAQPVEPAERARGKARLPGEQAFQVAGGTGPHGRHAAAPAGSALTQS